MSQLWNRMTMNAKAVAWVHLRGYAEGRECSTQKRLPKSCDLKFLKNYAVVGSLLYSLFYCLKCQHHWALQISWLWISIYLAVAKVLLYRLHMLEGIQWPNSFAVQAFTVPLFLKDSYSQPPVCQKVHTILHSAKEYAVASSVVMLNSRRYLCNFLFILQFRWHTGLRAWSSWILSHLPQLHVKSVVPD